MNYQWAYYSRNDLALRVGETSIRDCLHPERQFASTRARVAYPIRALSRASGQSRQHADLCPGPRGGADRYVEYEEVCAFQYYFTIEFFISYSPWFQRWMPTTIAAIKFSQYLIQV